MLFEAQCGRMVQALWASSKAAWSVSRRAFLLRGTRANPFSRRRRRSVASRPNAFLSRVSIARSRAASSSEVSVSKSRSARRTRLVGQAIAFGADSGNGLPVREGDLLPFLLAARAQAVAMSESKGTGRATFAEGLASSYEAFLDTRKGSSTDEELVADNIGGDRINRYVEKLAHALPNEAAYAQHPKVAPLVARVLDLWSQGEKVVVFCHYRQTGRALVRHVSAALEKRLWNDASQRLGLDRKGTRKAVTDFGGRFDVEGGMRRPLYDEITNRLAPYPELELGKQELIQDVIRRFVRTPLFVARYFDVNASSSERALLEAFGKKDSSGVSLGDKIDAFLKFIAKRCSADEQHEYLSALNRMQPGFKGDREDDHSHIHGSRVLPNIRLANGLVRQETRQRLMLAFNTPFFPDVLVASSVLAEGVDRAGSANLNRSISGVSA
jgi:hypothetical protein